MLFLAPRRFPFLLYLPISGLLAVHTDMGRKAAPQPLTGLTGISETENRVSPAPKSSPSPRSPFTSRFSSNKSQSNSPANTQPVHIATLQQQPQARFPAIASAIHSPTPPVESPTRDSSSLPQSQPARLHSSHSNHRQPPEDDKESVKSGFIFNFSKSSKSSDRPPPNHNSAGTGETMSRGTINPVTKQSSKQSGMERKQKTAPTKRAPILDVFDQFRCLMLHANPLCLYRYISIRRTRSETRPLLAIQIGRFACLVRRPKHLFQLDKERVQAEAFHPSQPIQVAPREGRPQPRKHSQSQRVRSTQDCRARTGSHFRAGEDLARSLPQGRHALFAKPFNRPSSITGRVHEQRGQSREGKQQTALIIITRRQRWIVILQWTQKLFQSCGRDDRQRIIREGWQKCEHNGERAGRGRRALCSKGHQSPTCRADTPDPNIKALGGLKGQDGILDASLPMEGD